MKNPNLIQEIDLYCTQHDLVSPNSTIVVGLSGGPDSVFLLHYLAQKKAALNLTIIAAHLDHQWRADSAQDVIFCSQLAQQLNLPFFSATLKELQLSIKFNGSLEEIGRKARRHFLQAVATDHGAQSIALAHHADDQQETFFIRLVRGSSLTGLIGMKPKQGPFIRPLLTQKKQAVIDYLDTHAIAYLHDPSNSSDIYLRNRIRNHLLPQLRACDNRFDQNFKTTHARLEQTEEFLDQLTHQQFAGLAIKKNATWHVAIDQLLALHPALQYRVILYWLCQENLQFPLSQAFFDELIRFLTNTNSKKHALTQNWSLIKNKDSVYAHRSTEKQTDCLLYESATTNQLPS